MRNDQMSRQPPLPKRPNRSRLQICISGEVHSRVDLYRAQYGLSEGRFFEMAALEKLNGMGDAKTTATRLRVLNEQMQILSELSHVFVKLWLQNTQLFTKEEQQATSAQTKALYQRLVQQIQTNLSGGAGFLDAFHQRLITSRLEAAEKPASTPADSAATSRNVKP